jgi:hypothetical protein
MEDGRNDSRAPVAVIGAGPEGLAAAARLVERGEIPLVFETGPEVGSNVSGWGHVRLFSPWRINMDAAAVRLLEASGWRRPPLEELPTGFELLVQYLNPLAALPEISAGLRLHSRVVGRSCESPPSLTATRTSWSFSTTSNSCRATTFTPRPAYGPGRRH